MTPTRIVSPHQLLGKSRVDGKEVCTNTPYVHLCYRTTSYISMCLPDRGGFGFISTDIITFVIFSGDNPLSILLFNPLVSSDYPIKGDVVWEVVNEYPGR